MGGLGRAHAVHLPRLRRRRARARGDPALLRLLLQGLDPRQPPRTPGTLGLDPLDGGRDRRVPHRALHLPPPLHRLLGRDDALRARAPAPEALRGRARDGVAGRRSSPSSRSFGGWLQVPWGWELVNDWIDPVAESAAEATGTTLVFSVLASTRPRGRGHLARLALVRAAERRARADAQARCPWAARTLEHKFYFDEAYDLAFYEPASRKRDLPHPATSSSRSSSPRSVSSGRACARLHGASPPCRPATSASTRSRSPPASPSSPSSSSS